MKRPKIEDFKVEYTKGIVEIASVIKQYSKAQDLYINHLEQLIIRNVSQQHNLLEWLSNEDYFNIPKDEINEILEDWQTYNSNFG